MNYYGYVFDCDSALQHHGILGQKWGVRRFQNKDGTLTSAGKKRRAENYSDQQRQRDEKIYGKRAAERINRRMLEGESIQSARHNEVVRKERTDKAKNVAKSTLKAAIPIGATVAVAALLKKYGPDSALNAVDNADLINLGKNIVNALL